MKQTKKKMVWLVAFLGVGSIQAFAKPFAEGPYLGQTPPGSTAQVFAPGLISNTRPKTWEAFATFSADANSFCFHRVEGVFISENTNQGWTRPKRIDIIRENHRSAWSPCLSLDGNSIFYTIADRNPRIKHYDLFRCMRTSQGWAKPQRLVPPLSSSSIEITCSIAANNNLYFCSGRERPPGGIHGNIIWAAPFLGNTWPRAEYVALNHPQAGDPGIAPDESFMVFNAKDLPGGYGHRDIYQTLHLPDGTG